MVVEETADFQQLPGAHPRHQASRQSWSVAIRNFLTSPFPFDCSGLLGSGKCCSVIISCGCGSRLAGHRARIGAKLFPGEEEAQGEATEPASRSPGAAARAEMGGLSMPPWQDGATHIGRPKWPLIKGRLSIEVKLVIHNMFGFEEHHIILSHH